MDNPMWMFPTGLSRGWRVGQLNEESLSWRLSAFVIIWASFARGPPGVVIRLSQYWNGRWSQCRVCPPADLQASTCPSSAGSAAVLAKSGRPSASIRQSQAISMSKGLQFHNLDPSDPREK